MIRLENMSLTTRARIVEMRQLNLLYRSISQEMNDQRRTALERSLHLICQDLDAEDVLPYLRTKGIVKEGQAQEILKISRKSAQNMQLIDFIKKGGPSAFQEFIKALQTSNKGCLAEKILAHLPQSSTHELTLSQMNTKVADLVQATNSVATPALSYSSGAQIRNLDDGKGTSNITHGNMYLKDSNGQKISTADDFSKLLKQHYTQQVWYKNEQFVWPTIWFEKDAITDMNTLLSYIIKPSEGQSSINITILEGVAGIGKSTIFRKIVSDWAQAIDSEYYEILIFIELAELQQKKYDTVIDIVHEWSKNQKIFSNLHHIDHKHRLTELITSSRTLIAVDEYSRNPNGARCTELTSILTDLEHPISNYFDFFIGKRPDRTPFVKEMNDRKIKIFEICGFTTEEQLGKYVAKKCNEEETSKIMKNLEAQTSLTELARIPLYLKFISFLPDMRSEMMKCGWCGELVQLSECYTKMCKVMIINFQLENPTTNVPEALKFRKPSTYNGSNIDIINAFVHEFGVIKTLGMLAFMNMNYFNSYANLATGNTGYFKKDNLNDNERELLVKIGLILDDNLAFPDDALKEYFAALYYCFWIEQEAFQKLNSSDSHNSTFERFIWDIASDFCQEWISKNRPEQDEKYPWLLMRTRLCKFFESKVILVFHLSKTIAAQCCMEILMQCKNAFIITIHGNKESIECVMDFSKHKKSSSFCFNEISFKGSSMLRLPLTFNINIEFNKCNFSRQFLSKLADHIRTLEVDQIRLVDFDLLSNSYGSDAKHDESVRHVNENARQLQLIWTRENFDFQKENLYFLLSRFDFVSKVVLIFDEDITFDIELPDMPKLETFVIRMKTLPTAASKVNIRNILNPKNILLIHFENVWFSEGSWKELMKVLRSSWENENFRLKRLELLKCLVEGKRVIDYLKEELQSLKDKEFFIEEVYVDKISENLKNFCA